jgi:hypothetical protein
VHQHSSGGQPLALLSQCLCDAQQTLREASSLVSIGRKEGSGGERGDGGGCDEDVNEE